MDDNQEESRIALKIVFILSLLLVSMDILEIYFAYGQLKQTSTSIDQIVFESCVKYHILSQIFFTFFATLAGISACIMSLGLLINFEFFAVKVMDSFLHFNYLIFGPYLFGSCVLGYYYFNQVAFTCVNTNINKKYLNFSTVLALFICVLFSFVVTLGYSIFWSVRKFIYSIRFRAEGNYVLGRIFWRYVFNRSNDSIQLANRQGINGLNVNGVNVNSNNGIILNLEEDLSREIEHPNEIHMNSNSDVIINNSNNEINSSRNRNGTTNLQNVELTEIRRSEISENRLNNP